MLLLQAASRVLEETIRDKLSRHANKLIASEPEKFVVLLADFDGVTYKVSSSDSKTTMLVSIALICYKELEAYGASKVLEREYGSYYQPGNAEHGYDLTLRIELDSLPQDKGFFILILEPLIKSLSLLKRNVMAAPYEAAFAAQAEKQESQLMTIHYRPNEAIYIKALPDRVTVIFSTEFKDETDRIYGKVFLQVLGD